MNKINYKVLGQAVLVALFCVFVLFALFPTVVGLFSLFGPIGIAIALALVLFGCFTVITYEEIMKNVR